SELEVTFAKRKKLPVKPEPEFVKSCRRCRGSRRESSTAAAAHPGCRRRLRQQLQEGVVVHRLHQVVIETGFARLAPVVILSPAGNGENGHILAPGLRADTAAHFEAVKLWQPDIEQYDVRAKLLGGL